MLQPAPKPHRVINAGLDLFHITAQFDQIDLEVSLESSLGRMEAKTKTEALVQTSTFPARLRSIYPNAVAVSLPVHSSWLNQIEIYFSMVQRKALTPMDVADNETLAQRLLDFHDYYQETAKPFSWKFTAADLENRLDALKNFPPANSTPKNL